MDKIPEMLINGHFQDCFMLFGSKMALIIHDNREYMKRAFSYCMMNTVFAVGIMIHGAV